MMQNKNQSDDHSKKIAVVLDVRKLVQRCQQLEQDAEAGKKQLEESEETVKRLSRDGDEIARVANFGRSELERIKKESLSRLRAIVHFSGEQSRLKTTEQFLSGEKIEPEEIVSLHQRISEEFQRLYPVRPFSSSPLEPNDKSVKQRELSSFKVCPNGGKSQESNREHHRIQVR